MPVSNWIEAVRLPTRVMIGLFIACLTLLAFDTFDVLVLANLGLLAKPVVIVASVVSGSLSLTGIVAFFLDLHKHRQKQNLLSLRHQTRTREAQESRAKAEAAALERLDHLAPQELRHLADALKNGSQSFYTYVRSPSVTTLRGKGLVYTPGGEHHQDHYPFTISDFVWKILIERKEEFLAKDALNRIGEEHRRPRSAY